MQFVQKMRSGWLPCRLANLIFGLIISDRDAVDASLRVISGDISAMERSFRAWIGASEPCSCRLSGHDARGWLPCWMANLIFREDLISDRDAAEGNSRRYLGDGAVFSSADSCIRTVHIPSVRVRCERMVTVLDGESDFQGGPHF